MRHGILHPLNKYTSIYDLSDDRFCVKLRVTGNRLLCPCGAVYVRIHVFSIDARIIIVWPTFFNVEMQTTFMNAYTAARVEFPNLLLIEYYFHSLRMAFTQTASRALCLAPWVRGHLLSTSCALWILLLSALCKTCYHGDLSTLAWHGAPTPVLQVGSI